MFTPRRIGAPAALVVTALALLVPSQALASHDLGIYKNEAHLDLGADEQTTSVSCLPGDHAIDGMWRVDHADQDEYVQPLDLIAGAVDVLAAYPSSDSTYSFLFEKNAIGRVQVKVFVTCLADDTQGGSHTHSFATAFTKNPGGAFTPTTAFDTASTTVAGTGSSTVPVRTTIDTTAKTCPSGTVLVSPGYSVDPSIDITGGEALPGMMRFYSSHSSNSSRDWNWSFENSALPLGTSVTIHTTWRCLKIKIPPTGFDKHKLITKYRTRTFNPIGNKVSEGQLNCGDAYKAILAGFDIPEGGVGDTPTAASDGTGLIAEADMPIGSTSAWDNVFYLGMDPRIKQRAYRFVNRGSSGSYNIGLSTLCVNYRTT